MLFFWNQSLMQGSFPACEKPDQLFAAPRIEAGTGRVMANALIDTIQSWHIPRSCIVAMSWDTTASNTGIRKGSATLFQDEMERSILWLGCRHHIGELHIKHANIAVRGPTTGMLKIYSTGGLTDWLTSHFNSIVISQHVKALSVVV